MSLAPPDRGVAESLVRLQVIDRLVIEAPRLEARKASAVYRIERDGQQDRVEMTYGFEEEVFDPQSPEDLNLAAMMTAQVALNYGLFCREIVFEGPFDAADQRFLRRMAANTAREIYVLKVLQPNSFLLPELQGLPALQRETYLQAEMTFPDAAPPPAETSWASRDDRALVLSSGGKDSLLSFGLLRELGLEVHPAFVNESGRHWLTALNAYRHFRDQIPNTARVWTSCDRVFATMLRNLPLVRPDFARHRSDKYPIRLWTVAVFLFGALPLMRKRGIGRLVIGDEFDTTVRERYQGITHYDGLYDQSRYFDDALTRYFLRKGWGVTQFSILRPMSELLIQKTLAERYPDLLELQVSCHAAHSEGERVRPCGRCEKCRRIAAMLLAIGVDPGLCGYREEQLESLAKALVEQGVSQEQAGAEHLAYLLSERALLPEPRLGRALARPRAEIEKLRFHPEKSPPNSLPLALRAPLFALVAEHAAGAVERHGRQWVEVDLAQWPALSAPYPHDKPQQPSGGAAAEETQPLSGAIAWGELNWPQAEERLKVTDLALLPVGAIEQHGPHLPLDTDSFDAEYLAREVAMAVSDPRPLVLPLVPYGVSYHHDNFAGTLSVSNETLSRLIYEIGMSAARNGINKLMIINGHGGNGPALHFAAQMINRDAHIFTSVDSGETSDEDIEALAETYNDAHAGEIETSTTLANRPHLVDMSRARSAVPRFSSHYLDFSSSRSVGWYAYTHRISASGVLGDPEKATADKGERMWQVMIKNLVELVEHLKGLSLAEIHQRRY